MFAQPHPCQVRADSCQLRTPHLLPLCRLPCLNGDAQMPPHRCDATDTMSGAPISTPWYNKLGAKAGGSCGFAEATPNANGSSSTKQSSSSRTCNIRTGRPTKSDMLRATGLSAAQSVLSFDWPKRHMEYDEQTPRPALSAAIVASVRARRKRLSLNSQGSQLKHALICEMASLVSGLAERHRYINYLGQ